MCRHAQNGDAEWAHNQFGVDQDNRLDVTTSNTIRSQLRQQPESAASVGNGLRALARILV
jgi:hypothetical protein